MKNKILLNIFTVVSLLALPNVNFAQAPNLGSTASFVLFSSAGAVGNSGTSQLTGNIGTNSGSSTGFGNVNGVMHDNNTTTAQASADLLVAYNQLNNAVPTFFPAPMLGNGQVLVAGIYSIAAAATLNLNLILNAEGNVNAVFIFQIAGPFSTNANSKVKLINGAQACNVFWKVEGLVDMSVGTTMRGTVIANNAAINMSTGDTLEGRALSTTGAVNVSGVLAYTPVGCGSAVLTGPVAPTLGAAGCYGIFSSDGAVTNTGLTNVTGDVGTNVGVTSGFDPLRVTGNIHSIPDNSTAQSAADLLVAYNYTNALPHEIELLYPVQFGNNLVLTPHTYIMNGSATLTDTLFLNAQNNVNAVFVIKIYGALSATAYSKIVFRNGTQAENVYWLVNGAVNLNNNTAFKGTIISQGAINLSNGVTLNGRALTGNGVLQAAAINGVANMIPASCATTGVNSLQFENSLVNIFPNPFKGAITLTMENLELLNKVELHIYNVLGDQLIRKTISSKSTIIETGSLPTGLYFYNVIEGNKIIQSGKLVSHQ